MGLAAVEELREDLDAFCTEVLASIPRKDSRAWGNCYLRGLMLEGRRKSIQPMVQRLPDGNMQALQQFVGQSPWDHTPVQRRLATKVSRTINPIWANRRCVRARSACTRTPLRYLVRLAKTRWRIEHDYRELKHSLGLDHYEGRTWRGWHHHVTLVSAAQAFLPL